MKREILFRGKRIDNGEWIEGDLLSKCKGSPKISIHGEYNRGLFVVDSYEVLPETVGMWTGLTDKNGKKIFEGDIVFGYARLFRSVVKWNSEQAGWSPFGDERTSFYEDESEIIGNIHDEEKRANTAKGG